MLKSGLYAGFILNMDRRKIQDMVYFLPPVSIPHYMAGAIFSAEHQPTEAERYLAYLHFKLMEQESRYTPFKNTLMKEFIQEFE